MQRLASPFPFGTSSLDWLAEYLKAGKNLLRLGIGRVRDQAVAVDMEAYYAKGKIQAFNATLRFLDEASTRSRRRGMRRGAMACHRRRYANAQTRKHTRAYGVPARA